MWVGDHPAVGAEQVSEQTDLGEAECVWVSVSLCICVPVSVLCIAEGQGWLVNGIYLRPKPRS